MKYVQLFLATALFTLGMNTARAEGHEISESPAVSLGLAILNVIPTVPPENAMEAATLDKIRTLKVCLELALDNAMTDACRAIKSIEGSFSRVQCNYSGAITGPANCQVKSGNETYKVYGAKAHALLQALYASGVEGEGAAGQRIVGPQRAVLSFNPSEFDGGAGAKVVLSDVQDDQGESKK
jgi:hypothetical protein